MFEANLYGYEVASKLEVEVTDRELRDGEAVYTLEIEELPAVFKHPASIRFEVTDVGGGFRFPTRGRCTIDVPVLSNITVKGELSEVRRGD